MTATETKLRELTYLGAVSEALHQIMAEDPDAVSYTHLTLPTILLV